VQLILRGKVSDGVEAASGDICVQIGYFEMTKDHRNCHQ
jgi:hypothetical protein